MKKKTKARLDHIEKRLQQLAEMVHELKGQRPAGEGARKTDVGVSAPRMKAIATKKSVKPSKAAAVKKVAAAKTPQPASVRATVKNNATKLAHTPTKKKVGATAQRSAKAKPAAKSAPKIAVTFQQRSTKSATPKSSGESSAVLSDPDTVTPVMGEAGKGGEFSA